MKRFVKKITLFSVLFVCSYILFFLLETVLIGNQFLGNYQASLLDKTERLQSFDKPKIILIGNSNVSFGFSSGLLEDAFDMPVVNMGLHGGLKNAFHENMVKLGLSEGDIVIVCHTSYFDDDSIGDVMLAWITLEHHKELYPLIRGKDILPLLRAFPHYVWKAVKNQVHGQIGNVPAKDTSYSRAALDEYGDIVFRPKKEKYIFTQDDVKAPVINDVCINRLNVLNQYVTEKNATLLIAGYPIGCSEFIPDAAEFNAFEAELRDKLDCTVISHFTDYFMPEDLFYDTSLHLTEEGAKVRTQILISDLKRWMDNNEK